MHRTPLLFQYFWLQMHKPRMIAHYGFSGCAPLLNAVANELCTMLTLHQYQNCTHLNKGFTLLHYTSSPHENPSTRALLIYFSGCRLCVHACGRDGACTNASSLFQPSFQSREPLLLFMPRPPSVSVSHLGWELRSSCGEQTANTSVHSVTFNQVSDCHVLHCSNGPWL